MCQGRPESPRPVTKLVVNSLESLPRLAIWFPGSQLTSGCGIVIIVLRGRGDSAVTFSFPEVGRGCHGGFLQKSLVCPCRGGGVSVPRVSTGTVYLSAPILLPYLQ